VKPGGDILFFAECPDGHGDETFYRMMIRHKTPREVIEDFRKQRFKMGDHKAFLWCRSLIRGRVHLHSALDEELTRTLMVHPVIKLDEFFHEIKGRQAGPARVAVMPKANSNYIKVS
jgi:nickel-dependent lactate racemase